MKFIKNLVLLFLLVLMSPFVAVFLIYQVMKHAYLLADRMYDTFVEWM